MVPESAPRSPRSGCLLAALMAGAVGGCAGGGGASHEMLNAVIWHQDSAEYRALARQSYALAALRLDEALATPDWSAALEQSGDASALAPAVILDLDETVVDNVRYEARIVTRLGEYSRGSFGRWCEEGGAAAVPGALGFLSYARQRGVRIFFYTAREERLRECTLRTLRAIGVDALEPTHVFLRGDGTKSEIRRRLSRTHRLVLLIGDSLEDFVAGSKATPDARRELARRHSAWFGRRWIVLPNAMYGHWEATHYDFDYAAPRQRKLERKRSVLRP